MGVLLTGEMLADWAEQALDGGAKYWYGTCWYKATEDLLMRKRKQYPSHYGDARMATYEKHIASHLMVCDCVGLIKGFFWTGNGAGPSNYRSNGCPDTSANGMYALCDQKGAVATLPDARGAVLWKKGHIGVYVGSGMAIEARGFNYGVVRTKVQGRGWQGWGYLPESMIAYAGENLPAEPILRRGTCGEAVERMQTLLIGWNADALPNYGVDGDFGSETRTWVRKFQRASGIEVDGIVGPITWGRLKAQA